MDSLEAVVRAEMEPLQYLAFFGALVLLGLIEPLARLGAAPPPRWRRWPVNAALTGLNIVVLGAIPVGGVAAADWAREAGIGLFNVLAVPLAAALVAGVLLRSLVSWAVHLAMHKLPPLWRVHRVHHSDTAMDVSTTVRFHPLEFLIGTPALLAAAVALGIPPLALMLYELFDAAMAVFTHADVRIPPRLERALRLVLVTPAMHRIHHSAWQAETDSNYGATFSFWDRLFGTWRDKEPAALAATRLGLAEMRDRRATSLVWLLASPFVALGPAEPGVRAAGAREAAR